MRNGIPNLRNSDLQERTSSLDWESLRTVLAVTRARSLAGAARALDLRHSTVFRRIEEVERRIGQPLFDRHRGGWTANELGETAARAAQAMEEAALEAERRLLGADGRLAGTIRVATSELVGGYLLSRVIDTFLTEHPAVEIEVDVSNNSLDLTRREADVAIRATRTPPDSLVGRKLATPGYAVYAVPSLLPRGKVPDLETLPWIGFDERLAHLPVARWFDGVLSGARPRLRMDSLATMLRAAVAGAGAAVLPTFAASQEPGLVRVTDVISDVHMELWLLSHPDLRGSARIRAFTEHLTAALPKELEKILECGTCVPRLAPCPVQRRRAQRATQASQLVQARSKA
jgi:DNA-binding transcriptional LysR family regulator